MFGEEFKRDTQPIGAVVNSLLDLEGLTNQRWLRLDGRYIARSKIDQRLQKAFPMGKITATARTLTNSPSGGTATNTFPAISSGGIIAVKADSSGTAGVQYSSNGGVSWSVSGVVLPTTFSANSIIWAGSRFIAWPTAGQAYVTPGSTPGAVWTATTGGYGAGQQAQLVYAPAFAKTFLLASVTAGGFYSLADGATAWAAVTLSAPKNAAYYPQPNGGLWTGSRALYFFGPTQNGGAATGFHYTDDGTNWYTKALPHFGRVVPATASPATDGAGTIVLPAQAGGGFLVSNDHGDSWAYIAITLPTDNYQGFFTNLLAGILVQFANGKFWAGDANGTLLCSYNGIHWGGVNYSLEMQLTGSAYAFRVAYDATNGVYVNWQPAGTATSALETFTEDMAIAKLPIARDFLTASAYSQNPGCSYMKVRN